MQLIVDTNFHNRLVRVYMYTQRGNEDIIIGQKNGKIISQNVPRHTPIPIQIKPLLEMYAQIGKIL